MNSDIIYFKLSFSGGEGGVKNNARAVVNN